MDAATSTDADANDIYDRQIRLWGADAQNKISSAQILYVYCTGVSMEILKNLVLAGVQPAILDGRSYPNAVERTPSSFFPVEERLGENRPVGLTVARAIQKHVYELNPLLKECEINEESDLANVPDEFFAKFDVVICSTKVAGVEQANRIATATTKAGGSFFTADTFGMTGVAVIDLGVGHKYRREIGKDKLSDWETYDFPSLKDVHMKRLNEISDRWRKSVPVPWAFYRTFINYAQENGNEWPSREKDDAFVASSKQLLTKEGMSPDYLGDDILLKSFAAIADAEIAPVCAVLGGVIGQEVIKALSGKGEPAKNTLLFDGTDGGCFAIYIG